MAIDLEQPVPDQIFLRDHVRDIEIGAFNEERGIVQRVSFTVVVEVNRAGPADDNVDLILSYDNILEAIDAELSVARVDLLETLAEGIATRVLQNRLAAKALVRIEKLDRTSGALGIEIARTTPGLPVRSGGQHRPHVFCLALNSVLPELPDAANIIVVDGADPSGPATVTQSRKDMLRCEIAAWGLAEKHAELTVVGSRTELIHAIQNQKSVVWAPSRMVFSASEGVDSLPQDIGGLSAWLAKEFSATYLTFVGVEVPKKHDFNGPIRSVET